ncbi:MAG: anthranilate synthase component I family protein [Polyangiaceae bacterium]
MGHDSAQTSFNKLLSETPIRGVPADPVEIARRLAPLGDVVALVSATASLNGSAVSFVTAAPAEQSTALVPRGGVLEGWHSGGRAVPEWVGVVPYEAARSLERPNWRLKQDQRGEPHHLRPSWRRYPSVIAVDPSTSRVVSIGSDASHQRSLIDAVVHPRRCRMGAELQIIDEDLVEHQQRVRSVLELISRGDLYQVNIARRITLHVKGEGLHVFEKMVSNSPTSYCCYLSFDGSAVLSTSPEEFLFASPNGRVVTRPIKGTRPRGESPDDDVRVIQELDSDAKERAELAMVIDLERNDLGRVAATGSVRVERAPRIETHRTLHHRVAEVSAVLPTGTSWEALVSAMFPSGSVTGAPKVRAMEVIADLETHRRGLYTGAIGYVGHGGELVLSMAIRTLTLRDEEGHYHVGGGIVADSDPLREEEETRVKSLQLLRALEQLRAEG